MQLQTMLAPMKRKIKGALRRLRNLRPRLAPADFTGKFKGNGFEATVRVFGLSKELLLGADFTFQVEAELAGPNAARAAEQGISLGVHWGNAGGSGYLCYDDSHRVLLFPASQGGKACRVAGVLHAPNTACEYILEFGLVDARGKWLAVSGSPRFPAVHVEGRQAETGDKAFDYVNIYSKLDLDKDYWTIVGPGSREEFETLGKGKMEFLVTRGLGPDSRILDVGCGTGQIAQPLLDYLSPKGLYVGTDIAPEAIDFCRRKYPKPNFLFEVNGMTTLPLSGVDFHLIYLCSVFTHMYPDETRDMLKTLRGLLAPGGKIIADVFHSPNISGSVGSRSMVVLGEGKLASITSEAGLGSTALRTSPWNATTKRSILEFTPV